MFHFVVKDPSGKAAREFDAPLFPLDKKTRLLEFARLAERLNDTAFVKRLGETKISIHLGNDGRVRDVGTLPQDEVLEAFLHRIRPFYLQSEQTHFESITKLVSSHFQDSAITGMMRNWRRHYDGSASKDVFEINVLGKVLNSREFFDNYLNALEFHRDPERLREIGKLATRFPLEVQKPVFVLLLTCRLNAINKLTSFLKTIFDREDGRPLTIQ